MDFPALLGRRRKAVMRVMSKLYLIQIRHWRDPHPDRDGYLRFGSCALPRGYAARLL